MKNLNLWDVSVKDLRINSQKKLVAAYGHNDNSSTKELYVCTSNLIVSTYDEDGTIKWTKDLTYHVIPSDNLPVKITYLLLPCTLCVGFENGELMTISDDGQNCTVNGVCSDGLLAMEWSPDQELLVLVTKTMNSILMSSTFDPIHETNLLSNDFGEKQFITVGWGKKETQFHGSEGKQAAKAKNEVSADLTLAAEDVVKITWRGDGNLYAIGFALEGIRYFKVFDREGHVQYTSEKQPGVEANLSWRPSGSVIATTQKLPEKYVVAFFEKNGLKHGDFTIPVNITTKVEDLIWSSDSEILAIQCLDMEQNTQKLLLYTSSNYHWYLKQTLVFNSEQRISSIIWDNDFELLNNKKLHILLHNGQHYTYSWIWNVDCSRGKTDTDDAVVTVIDGNELLVTGFRQTVVPPPMAALKITCDAFINSVNFAPHHQDESGFDVNTFFVCTTDNKLVFYEQTKKFPLDYKILKTVEFNHYEFPLQYYNWFWLNRETIVCVEAGDNSYNLVEWSLNNDTIVKKHVESLAVGILRIQSHPNNASALFIQSNSGDVFEYITGGTVTPRDTTFNTPCHKFDVLLVDNEMYFIGLNHKGHLFFNNKKVINNVSSFFVHTHYLLLTTLQHVLLCAKLTKAGLMSISDYHQNSESTNVYKRKIERGAKLIIAVPNDTRTIFQMPRGNLETIQPRPLSLKIIGEYLDSLKYFEAFDLMRKQRINLNLIHDHDPDKFLNNTDIFLESIQNNSWLCLFLSDLEAVDVTETMYSSSYVEKNNGTKANNASKIIKICNIIREHLRIRSDSDGKILPLLTTYVKINTDIEFESALKLIKDLKERESSGSKLPVGSDEALRYLLYMVEVNKLFEVALGMYDFDLVLLVANKSQKDPKEYIPMLNELNDMEENYKRFTINKHLKKYGKAVQCLAKCGPDKYNELKTFVKYHSLYKEALALFSQSEDIYREISDDFGLFLKLKKQYTEAGIVYERAKNYDKAVECYKDALEWELALKSAKTWPKDKYDELCMQLISLLKQEKRHTDALIIWEIYLGNVEETILYSIENCQFKTAIRLCSLYDLNELRDEKLLPAVLEEYKNMLESIEKSWDKFVSQKQRLQIVRENKANHPVEPHDTTSYAHRDSDLYSDAGSTVASSASRGSSRTYRSSKNRRKHERKLASLKEGSQYEDVALIVDLHKLVVMSFKLRPLVRELNIALCWFNKDKEAFMLQTCLDKLLKEMKDSFKEIWTDELNIEATNACVAAQHVPEGCSVIPQGIASLEPHLRIAPLIKQINWKLDGLCS